MQKLIYIIQQPQYAINYVKLRHFAALYWDKEFIEGIDICQ